VFLRGELALPTGDAHDFAGESSWAASWGLIGRFDLAPYPLIFAATAGIRLRGDEVLVGDRVVGNEVFAATGMVARISPDLELALEVAGALGDKASGKRGPDPLELRAGTVIHPLPYLDISLRAGFGLNDEIGAPRLRIVLQLAYRGSAKIIEPAPPPPDDELLVWGRSKLQKLSAPKSR